MRHIYCPPLFSKRVTFDSAPKRRATSRRPSSWQARSASSSVPKTCLLKNIVTSTHEERCSSRLNSGSQPLASASWAGLASTTNLPTLLRASMLYRPSATVTSKCLSAATTQPSKPNYRSAAAEKRAGSPSTPLARKSPAPCRRHCTPACSNRSNHPRPRIESDENSAAAHRTKHKRAQRHRPHRTTRRSARATRDSRAKENPRPYRSKSDGTGAAPTTRREPRSRKRPRSGVARRSRRGRAVQKKVG